MKINCNAGSTVTNLIGDFSGFGEVWFIPNGIANFISLGKVIDFCWITMDKDVDNVLYIHQQFGGVWRFGCSSDNLYYCDLWDQFNSILTINTVRGNHEQYSTLIVRRADRVIKFQEVTDFPTFKEMVSMVDNNVLRNIPISRRDIKIAQNIYDDNANPIKGKTNRTELKYVWEDIDIVPPHILEHYRNVSFHVDIIKVNGIVFIRTVSNHLYFCTWSRLDSQTKFTLFEYIKKVVKLYTDREFLSTSLFVDGQFACLKDDLIEECEIAVHTCARNERNSFIERDNHFIKEVIRCIVTLLPFKLLPRIVVIKIVYVSTFWLNSCCLSGGVSQTISPRRLIIGIITNFSVHDRYQFGEYMQAYFQSDNTTAPKTVDSIYTYPTGAVGGGFSVIKLETMERNHRFSGRVLPMPNTVIDWIKSNCRQQGMKLGIYLRTLLVIKPSSILLILSTKIMMIMILHINHLFPMNPMMIPFWLVFSTMIFLLVPTIHQIHHFLQMVINTSSLTKTWIVRR